MKPGVRGVEPRWFAVFIFFLIGTFFGGFLAYLYTEAVLPAWIKQRLTVGDYQYINPTPAALAAENYGNFNPVNKDMESKVNGLVADAKQRGTVLATGIYFRDLTTGGWLDINDGMSFSAGSVLKVPLMMAYLKLADQDQRILTDSIHFTGPYLPQQNIFATSSSLIAGQDYTAADLIQKMISDSDETAAALLYAHTNQDTLAQIYNDLGITFNAASNGRYSVTLIRYASFFRSLYTATYLSPDSSEHALSLLAQNQSNSLLEADLPRSVPVAYRTGAMYLSHTNTSVEVYECSIVYPDQHAYLLCAVADAPRLENIRSLFGAIGSTVYTTLTQQ